MMSFKLSPLNQPANRYPILPVTGQLDKNSFAQKNHAINLFSDVLDQSGNRSSNIFSGVLMPSARGEQPWSIPTLFQSIPVTQSATINQHSLAGQLSGLILSSLKNNDKVIPGQTDIAMDTETPAKPAGKVVPSPTIPPKTDMPTKSKKGPTDFPDNKKTPTPSTNGSGSGYVNMMVNALKANGAGEDLVAAYLKQYELLGLTGSGAKPGGDTPTTPDTPAEPNAPKPPATPTLATPTPEPLQEGGEISPDETTKTPKGMPSGDTKKPEDTKEPKNPAPKGETKKPDEKPIDGNVSESTQDTTGVQAENPVFTNAGNVDWANAPPPLQKLKAFIQSAASKTKVSESIIAAVIWKESRGNVSAGGGAPGLMQIDPTTYSSEIGGKKNGLPPGTTPIDAETNILAGATYIDMLRHSPRQAIGGKAFPTWELALRAYNSGEYGVDMKDYNARPKGGGDTEYIPLVKKYVQELQTGTLHNDS